MVHTLITQTFIPTVPVFWLQILITAYTICTINCWCFFGIVSMQIQGYQDGKQDMVINLNLSSTFLGVYPILLIINITLILRLNHTTELYVYHKMQVCIFVFQRHRLNRSFTSKTYFHIRRYMIKMIDSRKGYILGLYAFAP